MLASEIVATKRDLRLQSSRKTNFDLSRVNLTSNLDKKLRGPLFLACYVMFTL